MGSTPTEGTMMNQEQLSEFILYFYRGLKPQFVRMICIDWLRMYYWGKNFCQAKYVNQELLEKAKIK